MPQLRNTNSAPFRALKIAVFGALFFVAGPASAADFRYEAKHTTSKAAPRVWKIMSAYSQICDKGCKYHRPDLVRVKKVSYRASKNSWYTWSHVSTLIKDVKYFTKVTIKRESDGSFVADNRQVVDKKLIRALEKNTGLEHSPAFDAGNTRTIAKTLPGGKTQVTLIVTLSASGVVAMWPSKVRAGIKKGVAQTFKNIEQ